jgi:antitoxin VapB
MAFHIKNPETDALARRVAALKKLGLTEAVHTALAHELERAKGNPQSGKTADKAFRDSLYEDA